MFHQVTGNSRSKETIARVQSLFPTQHSVDFFFIDGDHVDCAPDFHLYQSLVRPGGVIMFDDYHDRRVKKSVKTILSNSTVRKCYHILGPPLNVAKASTLGSTNAPPLLSNEFIMQKKFDCAEM
jgi:hypothetical protein